MKCWASSVSECCGTQSREHYVTKGLFSGKKLYVENAPFLQGESKEISKASLTKKCLCKRHNELLSPYDDAAIAFGRALVYCKERVEATQGVKKKNVVTHTKFVDYDKFSRWYIKTFLGFAEFFKYESELSSDFLAKLVYSTSPIRDYINFTISMVENEDFEIEEKVSIAPLERGDRTLGMQVELYGIRVRGEFSAAPEFKQKPLRMNFTAFNGKRCCCIRFK